ncbi:MAG TPA: 2,3-bisphosphoglycerate-independent phosphoglycerate mutase [Patescibacteria group bacterium]|nr:2,3-bisphosphoglycerate-independent phosphoglycerate mutase [Patescibacteria group bacterium]
MQNDKGPIALIVLDGWGISESKKGNAIANANLPTIKKIEEYYPGIALQASGISVGLPWGEPGNSEVGHMTLGTGKVVYQSMPRITMSIQSKEFFRNPALLKAIDHVKNNDSSLHIMGLVGKGGIHSSIDHLYALLEMAKNERIERLFIHVFTDGRDSAPTSGVDSIKELEIRLKNNEIGKIASIGGRYFGMDRNNNWDRIKKAYDAMVNGIGEKISDPIAFLEQSYAKEIFDEYIEPAVVVENDVPVGKICDNDAIIFFNFREDRARQITKALALPGFSKFERSQLKNFLFVAMTQYEEKLPVEVAFGPIAITNCLGETLSKNKLTQLRIAETEKFAHVTYFFNGGIEEAFPGEERVIVPSKAVSTFAEAPEMSAPEITEKLHDLLKEKKYDFILLNFANADIVGHTGNEKATVSAVESVDANINKIIKIILEKNGQIFITADHGNAEEMTNNHTGEIDTEHSVNPVPLWYITSQNHREKPKEKAAIQVVGLLSDVAPTILELLQIPKPKEMTGESLLELLI